MVEMFLEVKNEFPDFIMVLMGVGFHSPEKSKIEELILKNNLQDSFLMLPWMKREDIFPIIKNAKLYISTSRYEGLPYSIIESMAIGKAFVVTDCDGNRDLVQQGVNGFVVDQNNLVEQMPKAICTLLNNEQKRNEFEKNSLTLFHQNYNIEKTIGKLEAIYEEFAP